MEPRIQYAKTDDGVSIAFWAMGEGPPVVNMPGAPSSHIALECKDPDFQRWYRRQMRTQRVVRYDPRGTGLSDRDTTDFSTDAWLRDLDAVVDALGLERFALAGICFSGPAAIAYAARHPERVSHLILWCTYARAIDASAPQFETLLSLVDKDWELFSETMAHAMVAGWAEGDRARRFAQLFRDGITPEAFNLINSAWADLDVTELLQHVRAETYVLHRREATWPSFEGSKTIAAGIPGARLRVFEGTSVLPFVGDMEPVAQLFESVLGTSGPAWPVEGVPETSTGLVTILFTDMQSSTAFTQRLGDAGAQEVRRAHNDIVREALAANAGSEIKHTGDGIMASFSTASAALDAAIAIQRGVAQHKEANPDSPLAVYVGLNAGEPIAEGDSDGRIDLFGTSINLAARICDHAEPGQIVAADVVRQLAAGKDFLFADLGETELRGFEDPVRLYEVRWRTDAGS